MTKLIILFHNFSSVPKNIISREIIAVFTLFPANMVFYNLQKAVYSLYNKSNVFNVETATNKTKEFGFVGTDHLRAKIIINDEVLDQVNQFTYLCYSLSYQCSNDVEFKLAKCLQLIGTIKKIIFKKVRTEIVLKL